MDNDTKLQMLRKMVIDCYNGPENHSSIVADEPKNYGEDSEWCPRNFDGFSCWDSTPANGTAVQQCPNFIVGFDPRRVVYKSCTENATWETHPLGKRPWTNYTTCVDHLDLQFRSLVNNIYVGGYSISVAALVLSLMVFFYFRSLRCTRIKVHMHLFSSVGLNNIFWIIWYKTVVNTAAVVQANEFWCQGVHIITNFFMVTSYLWMFCESLHLHVGLVVVFVNEDIAMMWFLAIGWGLSFIITATYAVVRYCTPGATERCWTEQSDTFWIINVPVIISLGTSFVFLVNVVRVLLAKLTPLPNRVSMAAKKATKATLILIPLFGLHYVLIPFRPSPDAPYEKAYQIISALLISLQGLCLAVMFCFTNYDVVQVVKIKWQRVFRPDEGIAMIGFTGGESMAHTRENVV